MTLSHDGRRLYVEAGLKRKREKVDWVAMAAFVIGGAVFLFAIYVFITVFIDTHRPLALAAGVMKDGTLYTPETFCRTLEQGV